jgi:tetratricopeptide (TPR) repeat protein
MKKNKTVNKNQLIFYLIIALFSFAIYANSLKNDFVFDDESVVQTNLSIQNLSNIPKYFSAEEGFHKVIGRYYRPIVSTTYALDYAVWGLNPLGFHLTNIIINLICSLILFAILLRLFGNYKFGILAALISTLIFTSHPVHTEAVSWISGRTDSIAALFFFASFLFYIKYSENLLINPDDPNNKKINSTILISLFFYILGLLSKEMVVTLPVIIILFDFVYLKQNFKKLLKERIIVYILFISVTLLYLLIRYLALKNVPERETYMYFYGKDFMTAVSTMITTIPVYLKLLVLPINLIYHYNGVIADSISFFDINVILSLGLIALLLIAVYLLFKKSSEVSFSILFIFISLIPVMNFIPSMNLMAERFLYLTSFALSILTAYVLIKFEQFRKFLIVLFSVIILLFSILTFLRNQDWKDNDTLYSTADGINGSVLLVNMGNIFANKKQYDEAAIRYRKALEIRQNSVLANHNLGLTFLVKGELDSAENYIKRGIAVDTLAPDGYFQLSNIYQSKGNIPDAIKYLEKLQTITPDYRGSKQILENLKASSINKPDNQINPGNPIDLLDKRSYQYYQEGKYDLAVKDLLELTKLNPTGKAGYYNNIALCYISLKDYTSSEKYYKEAIKADDNNTAFKSGLADLYLKMDKREKAIEYYKKVLEKSPDDNYVKNKLDSLNIK